MHKHQSEAFPELPNINHSSERKRGPSKHPTVHNYPSGTVSRSPLLVPLQKGCFFLTEHRETVFRLSGVSQILNSCCCSSSVLSGRGSWTQSGCTLRATRKRVNAGRRLASNNPHHPIQLKHQGLYIFPIQGASNPSLTCLHKHTPLIKTCY